MMKKQMKRTVYEAPITERFSVELEGSLMAASIVDETNSTGVNANGHEIGTTTDVSKDFVIQEDGFVAGWE